MRLLGLDDVMPSDGGWRVEGNTPVETRDLQQYIKLELENLEFNVNSYE